MWLRPSNLKSGERIPDLSDVTIVIITNASPGSLAFEAAKSVAVRFPGLLILTAQKISVLEEVREAILSQTPNANIRLLDFDLASQDSVRKAALSLTESGDRFNILVHSAGVMASPYGVTTEGIKSQFGINHIGKFYDFVGPFLFTNLIIPILNAGASIVNVTSQYNMWQAYAQSKAANILFSAALARKSAHKDVRSFSVHPGSIVTNLGRHLTQEDYDMLFTMSGIHMEYKTAQQGAANMTIAAFDPFIKGKSSVNPISEKFDYAFGVANEERLWELSEQLVNQKFSY
ncbi:hypothetical protein BJX70DRAFT_385743 [Aspergillus crustosus]